MVKITILKKNPNWDLRQTHSKMDTHDMVAIDTIVIRIVGGGGFKRPLPGLLTFSKTQDRIGQTPLNKFYRITRN